MEAADANCYKIEPGEILSGADLELTTWPEGFDPKAAGVTFT